MLNSGRCVQAVYTVLREAEYRSTYPLPYWNLPLMRLIVPRQRRCQAALATINRTLSGLIAKSKRVVSLAKPLCAGSLRSGNPKWPLQQWRFPNAHIKQEVQPGSPASPESLRCSPQYIDLLCLVPCASLMRRTRNLERTF